MKTLYQCKVLEVVKKGNTLPDESILNNCH